MFIEQYCAIKDLCEKYYSKKEYAHAKAVESYVIKDIRYSFLTVEKQWLLRAAALAHDLLEDTDCTYEELAEISFRLADIVKLLTHDASLMSYYTYCKKIIESEDYYAITVKASDIKDHLMRKKTLTAKLIEKYSEVIPLFIKGA